MKERIVKWTEKRRLFTIMFLALFIISFGFQKTTNAQGWGFSAQLVVTGNCAGFTYPLPGTYGIPTKSQCESVRQSILAISSSGGGCEAHFTCTPCSGSDIAISSGDLNPGGISNNGQVEGKPIFTPHQSQAAEDFWNDYKQQLLSYGVTSIYGNQLYLKKSHEFEPPPDDSPDNSGAPQPRAPQPVTPKTNDQDITYKSVPIMGGSPMTVEEMERQKLIKQFGPNYVDQANMYMSIDNGAIDKKKEEAHPYIELGRQAAIIGAGFLEAESVTPAIVIIDVVSETMVKPGIALYNEYKGTGDVVPGTEEILVNTCEKIAQDLVGSKLGEAGEHDIKLITNPQVQQEMISNGVLPGIAKISEKPGQIAESTAYGYKVFNSGNDGNDAWNEFQKSIHHDGNQ